MAVGDYTTVQNLKDYMGIASASDDDMLSRIVSSASSWIANQIQRDLSRGTQVDTFEWNLSQERKQSIRRFRMSRSPVVSIADDGVTLDGVTLPKWVQSAGTPADSTAGWLIRDGSLELVGWPFLGSDTWTYSSLVPSLTTSIRFVTATYVGGYITYDADGVPSGVPGDIEQATIELAGEMLRRRDRLGIRSRSIAGETQTYLVDSIPPGIQAVIDQYKRSSLG